MCPLDELAASEDVRRHVVRLDNGFEGTIDEVTHERSLSLTEVEDEDSHYTCTTAQESYTTYQTEYCKSPVNHASSDTSKKPRHYAVGVADTGSGLSKARLQMTETQMARSDSDTKTGGVTISGFGLHLAHLLSKAIGTHLSLSSPDACRHVLSDFTLDAIDVQKHSLGENSINPASYGTVLYFTLPMYEKHDEHDLVREESGSDCSSLTSPSRPATPAMPEEIPLCVDEKQYAFNFKPSP